MMLITLYATAVLLVAVLLFVNVRSALTRYALDKNTALLFMFLVFLVLLGYGILHVTMRVASLVQISQDVDGETGAPLRQRRLLR